MRKSVVALALFFLPSVTNAIEEPDYAVMRKWGAIEVRFYAPYVVAQVLATGPGDMAGNQGCPILADDIFGANKGEKPLAGVTPPLQTGAPAHLEMTAPVTQAEVPNGFVVQFVLPKYLTLDAAPDPIDECIQLRAVAESNRAANRAFGGTQSGAASS